MFHLNRLPTRTTLSPIPELIPMSEWPLMLQELYQSGQLSLEEVAENLATIETSASQVSTNTSSSCLKAAATSVDDSTILSSSFIFSTSTKRERQLAIYQLKSLWELKLVSKEYLNTLHLNDLKTAIYLMPIALHCHLDYEIVKYGFELLKNESRESSAVEACLLLLVFNKLDLTVAKGLTADESLAVKQLSGSLLAGHLTLSEVINYTQRMPHQIQMAFQNLTSSDLAFAQQHQQHFFSTIIATPDPIPSLRDCHKISP